MKDRKKLLADAGLLPEDYYVADGKYIIRRTGMDKLEKKNPITIAVESINTVPYGSRCCTTILGSGKLTGFGTAGVVRSVASANPDNCKFSHYAEVAYKRLRHRLLLSLIDLYEYDIYSVEESDEFVKERGFEGVVKEIESKRQKQ